LSVIIEVMTEFGKINLLYSVGSWDFPQRFSPDLSFAPRGRVIDKLFVKLLACL